MRAVLDTNVFVSAVIRPGSRLGRVLDLFRGGAFTLLYSASLLAELRDVLGRAWVRERYNVTDEDVEALMGLLDERGEEVSPARRIAVCRDPEDDQVLEAAVAGRADVVVSGDADLLVHDPFERIRIVRPSEFLAMLERETDV